MLKLLALLFFTITLGTTQGAYAGPFEDGEAAYNRKDYATALSMWRPLAAQGNAEAQCNLGNMYKDGKDVVEDHKKIAKLYRLAVDQGDAWAQNSLGIMYARGQGVPKDYKEAVKWFRLAAAQGYAYAQYALGLCYGAGQGVAQDDARAHMWFLLSVSNGYSAASKFRDIAAKWLTAAQIAQAQEIARKCKAYSYQQCD